MPPVASKASVLPLQSIGPSRRNGPAEDNQTPSMFSMMLTKTDRPEPSAASREAVHPAVATPPRRNDSARPAEAGPSDQAGATEAGETAAVATSSPQNNDPQPPEPGPVVQADVVAETLAVATIETDQCAVMARSCAPAKPLPAKAESATASTDDEATGDSSDAGSDTDQAQPAIVAATPAQPAITPTLPAPAVIVDPGTPATSPAPADEVKTGDRALASVAAVASDGSSAIASTKPDAKASSLPAPAPAAPQAEPANEPTDPSAQSNAPARTIHAAVATLASSPKQPVRDPVERRTGDHPLADVVQQARPDGLHLTSLLGGHDLGPTAAATAPAAAAKDGSNPAAAPVPLDGLAVEIAARASHGHNRFEIRLDPPELGRIDVRLDIDRSGQVTSRLVVERTETLDVLRRDAHQLERALQDAGLQTANNGLQFTLRDQGFSDRSASFGAAHGAFVDADQPTADVGSMTLTLRGRGGVDIRV